MLYVRHAMRKRCIAPSFQTRTARSFVLGLSFSRDTYRDLKSRYGWELLLGLHGLGGRVYASEPLGLSQAWCTTELSHVLASRASIPPLAGRSSDKENEQTLRGRDNLRCVTRGRYVQSPYGHLGEEFKRWSWTYSERSTRETTVPVLLWSTKI